MNVKDYAKNESHDELSDYVEKYERALYWRLDNLIDKLEAFLDDRDEKSEKELREALAIARNGKA